jgi:hypothetical protein
VITQIDVFGVLASVGSGSHRDLVTRSTGRAVRSSIEMQLAQLTGLTVVVLDFSSVRLIDCSCADEIVAKLLQSSLAPEAGAATLFLIRGLNDHQIEEITEVLKRHQLALVAESHGGLQLLGDVADQARLAFQRIAARGYAAATDLAADLAWPLEDVHAALSELTGRRLVIREDKLFYPPFHTEQCRSAS